MKILWPIKNILLKMKKKNNKKFKNMMHIFLINYYQLEYLRQKKKKCKKVMRK